MSNIVFLLGLFLLSLYSFYFLGAPVLTLFGFILILVSRFLLVKHRVIERNVSILFLLILYSLAGIGALFGSGVDLTRFVVFFSFFILLFFLSIESNRLNVSFILKFFLVLHLIFFYSQFVFYYLFGWYFSALQAVGLESRNFGGIFTLPWGAPLMRTSGLFSEPGTYACFLAPIIALYSRYAIDKFSKWIFYLALLSLALSLSTFGFVFFSIIVFFLISTFFLKSIVLLIGLIFGSSYFYWRFFVRPEAGLDSGLGFRSEYISGAFSNFTNVKGFFLGHGGFSINSFLFKDGGADNDSGLIFYILYNFGGFAFIISILFILYSVVLRDRASAVGLAILFCSKMSFFAYAFPVYLFLLMRRRYFI